MTASATLDMEPAMNSLFVARSVRRALPLIEVRGFVYTHGIMAAVSDVDMVEHYHSSWQRPYTAAVTEEFDRKTIVIAECFIHYTSTPEPPYRMGESTAVAELGRSKSVAWMKVVWPRDYLDHIDHGNQ